MKTYTITLKHKGHQDQVRRGVDQLNAIIIPAELKIAFAKQFENGSMEVIVEEER